MAALTLNASNALRVPMPRTQKSMQLSISVRDEEYCDFQLANAFVAVI